MLTVNREFELRGSSHERIKCSLTFHKIAMMFKFDARVRKNRWSIQLDSPVKTK